MLAEGYYSDPKLAEYFDITDAYEGDFQFYKDLAEGKRRLLELGVGTGRVALMLAATTGASVTGIDSSAAMLERARAKVHERGLESLVSLVQADMQDFTLPACDFDLAFAAEYSFAHLHSVDDQLRCLRKIYEHLAVDGLLVIHMFQGNPRYFGALSAGGVGGPQLQDGGSFQMPNGNILQLTLAPRYCRSEQLLSSHVRFEEVWPDGRVEVRIALLRQHVFVRSELELLLMLAGFKLESVCGTLDGSPFTDDSWELLVTARKPTL